MNLSKSKSESKEIYAYGWIASNNQGDPLTWGNPSYGTDEEASAYYQETINDPFVSNGRNWFRIEVGEEEVVEEDVVEERPFKTKKQGPRGGGRRKRDWKCK